MLSAGQGGGGLARWVRNEVGWLPPVFRLVGWEKGHEWLVQKRQVMEIGQEYYQKKKKKKKSLNLINRSLLGKRFDGLSEVRLAGRAGLLGRMPYREKMV